MVTDSVSRALYGDWLSSKAGDINTFNTRYAFSHRTATIKIQFQVAAGKPPVRAFQSMAAAQQFGVSSVSASG